MDEDEVVRRMEIINDNSYLFDILEECDSKECVYTWEALIAGSCEYMIDVDKRGGRDAIGSS